MHFFQKYTGIFHVTLQNLSVAEEFAMEKSWENFWTTGKVEDYLTYRNGLKQSDEEVAEDRQDRQEDKNAGERFM